MASKRVRVLRLGNDLSIAAVAISAFLFAALPIKGFAQTNSCDIAYQQCTSDVQAEYTACMLYADTSLSPQSVCAASDPGSFGYTECLWSASGVQTQYETACNNYEDLGDSQCESSYESCSLTGSLLRHPDRIFRSGLPPAKLPVSFQRHARAARHRTPGKGLDPMGQRNSSQAERCSIPRQLSRVL